MTARFRLAAAGPLLCSTLLLSGCGSGAPPAASAAKPANAKWRPSRRRS